VFAKHIEACERALAPHVEWSLTEVLRGAPQAPALEGLDVVQPVLFAVMVSLAELWRACGVRPHAVVGHSQGEIAAAYVAGGLSLEDATRVVALRSRVLAKLVGHGAVVSLAASVARVQELLEPWGDAISIGGINGPSSVTVVGPRVQLAELLAKCAESGIRAREVPATVASHSPQVDPLREEMLEVLAGIVPLAGEVPFYSTATDAQIETTELDAEYWYRNVREPVRFESTIRRLLDDGFRLFVEVSPHPILSLAITETIEDLQRGRDEAQVVASLRRGDGGSRRFLASLGEAWAQGAAVDWEAVFAGSGATRVALPTYAFQRKRYWSIPDGEHAGGIPVLSVVAGDASPSLAHADVTTDASLVRKLSEGEHAKRGEIILRAVQEQTAAVLGEASPEDIDPAKNLLELGFDSMKAVELRGRLSSIANLRIPTSVMFDRPTPDALASYIDSRLADLPSDGPVGSDMEGLRAAHQSGQDGSAGTLTAMLRTARESGTVEQFMNVLMTVSKFRPVFHTASASEINPEWVKLCTGVAQTGVHDLICVPTALALSGPHNYVRFAEAFRDSHAVSALALPGFAPEELLPESLEALVETLALAVRGQVGEDPFVLVGHSSGGWLANAIASRLERVEEPVAPSASAVVLLDAYPAVRCASGQALLVALGGALADDALGLLGDDRLVAMGAYLRLLEDWQPVRTVAPTLFVRAGGELAAIAELEDERNWEFAGGEIEVPGNHLTMMEEHVDATAEAVQGWLSTTFDKQGVMDSC
jgi:malonyl CoA-acyl carrier protein transacylase/aryl carrier-like protein/pimeloyl-ACP methyl ester carboxylesterase